MLAVCGVQCTSCTECDLELVASITNAAPILTDREYMHGGVYMALGVCISTISVYIITGIYRFT